MLKASFQNPVVYSVLVRLSGLVTAFILLGCAAAQFSPTRTILSLTLRQTTIRVTLCNYNLSIDDPHSLGRPSFALLSIGSLAPPKGSSLFATAACFHQPSRTVNPLPPAKVVTFKSSSPVVRERLSTGAKPARSDPLSVVKRYTLLRALPPVFSATSQCICFGGERLAPSRLCLYWVHRWLQL